MPAPQAGAVPTCVLDRAVDSLTELGLLLGTEQIKAVSAVTSFNATRGQLIRRVGLKLCPDQSPFREVGPVLRTPGAGDVQTLLPRHLLLQWLSRPFDPNILKAGPMWQPSVEMSQNLPP